LLREWENAGHEGPVFKFPCGIPRQGSLATALLNWDICQNLGVGRHRPRVRVVVRVKPCTRVDVASQRLCIGDEAASEPFRRIDLMHGGLSLYCDDDRPYVRCAQCGKRHDAGLPHTCEVFPAPPPAPEWTAPDFFDRGA
jgi:hypothetical protein